MNKYDVLFSERSREDIKELTLYIKDTLGSSKLSLDYYEDLMADIKGLEIMPNRFEKIETKVIKQDNIRRLIHKNFIIFYIVDEDKELVYIERVVYGASDWKKKI